MTEAEAEEQQRYSCFHKCKNYQNCTWQEFYEHAAAAHCGNEGYYPYACAKCIKEEKNPPYVSAKLSSVERHIRKNHNNKAKVKKFEISAKELRIRTLMDLRIKGDKDPFRQLARNDQNVQPQQRRNRAAQPLPQQHREVKIEPEEPEPVVPKKPRRRERTKGKTLVPDTPKPVASQGQNSCENTAPPTQTLSQDDDCVPDSEPETDEADPLAQTTPNYQTNPDANVILTQGTKENEEEPVATETNGRVPTPSSQPETSGPIERDQLVPEKTQQKTEKQDNRILSAPNTPLRRQITSRVNSQELGSTQAKLDLSINESSFVPIANSTQIGSSQNNHSTSTTVCDREVAAITTSLYCVKCKSSVRFDEIADHVQNFHVQQQFVCSECNVRKRLRREMNKHYDTAHPKLPKNYKSRKLSAGDSSFSSCFGETHKFLDCVRCQESVELKELKTHARRHEIGVNECFEVPRDRETQDDTPIPEEMDASMDLFLGCDSDLEPSPSSDGNGSRCVLCKVPVSICERWKHVFDWHIDGARVPFQCTECEYGALNALQVQRHNVKAHKNSNTRVRVDKNMVLQIRDTIENCFGE